MTQNGERKFRPPIIGYFKLGVKKNGAPQETAYIVIPEDNQKRDRIIELFGEQPKELDILLPYGELEDVLVTRFEKTGTKGTICSGDGKASAWDKIKKQRVTCPCDQRGTCKEVAKFRFMIPHVSVDGLFEISTPSKNVFDTIYGKLRHYHAALGHFDKIPMRLKRIPKMLPGREGTKKEHFILDLCLPEEVERQMAAQMMGVKIEVPNKPEAQAAPDSAANTDNTGALTGKETGSEQVPAGSSGDHPLERGTPPPERTHSDGSKPLGAGIAGSPTSPAPASGGAISDCQKNTMPEPQRKRIREMMTKRGITEEKDVQAFFQFALGADEANVGFGNRFIKNFDAIHAEWIKVRNGSAARG